MNNKQKELDKYKTEQQKVLVEKKVILENYDHILIQLRKLYALYKAQKIALEEAEKEKLLLKNEIAKLEIERDMYKEALNRYPKQHNLSPYNITVM
jgi:hypothetical protein